MSNNRMYLENKRTGAKLLIAGYYPCTGWYPNSININLQTLSNFF